ncbi:TetR/AcrR family transcriptional regulator [Actinospongicola halichondriae]|uniref:TetR/AcrR family transcriptional regulator n=1 Tax=Actinospongicola halichondriae TaxID=3236844 RepID=UPI003D49F878
MSTPETSSGPRAHLLQTFAAFDTTDGTTTKVLDAALAEFSSVGIGRTSMEDVARRAGVSRQTVYRHVANKDALVGQVLQREFQRHAEQYVAEMQTADTAVERIVGGYSSTIQAIRSNPLLTSVLSHGVDTAVSSMAASAEHVLSMARMFLTYLLQVEQSEGEIAATIDVDVIADLMVRVAVSYVLIPSEVFDLADENATKNMVRTFLLPILGWTSAD